MMRDKKKTAITQTRKMLTQTSTNRLEESNSVSSMIKQIDDKIKGINLDQGK